MTQTWTDADTAAYWAEIAREQYGDWRKSLALLDPVVMREVQPDTDDGRTSAWEQATPTPIEDSPEWHDLWIRCVAHLPPRDRDIITAAYRPRAGRAPRGPHGHAEAPGRCGWGIVLARHFGLGQSAWVEALAMAERRLACVAPAVRLGHDRHRTVAQVAREANARQAANSARLRGRAAGGQAAATRDPWVIEVYLREWSIAAAARATGTAQSTAQTVVSRYRHLPLVAAISAAPSAQQR